MNLSSTHNPYARPTDIPPLPDDDLVYMLCTQKGVMSWQPIAVAEAEFAEDAVITDPPEGTKWYHLFLSGKAKPTTRTRKRP